MEDKRRLYVQAYDGWNELVNKNHFIDEPAEVKIYEEGMILPVKREKPAGILDYILLGGACDKDNNFVAGWQRKLNEEPFNKSCHSAYKVSEKDLVVDHQRVIFGGIIDEHFGHFMTESMSRLWYVIKNPDFTEKIVFLPDGGIKEWYNDFFALLGIKEDQIIYLDKPTRYDEVIVPDETMILWSGFKAELRLIYDTIAKNAPKKSFNKVYLTRGQLSKADCVNEEFFVEYFKEQGYEIIAPETLPIMEQVSIAASAKEIATTGGTLSHFVIFAEQGTKITILNRHDFYASLEPQVLINKVRNADYYFVDVSKNFLPVRHSRGCFLLEPTKLWEEYLSDNGMPHKDYSDEKMHANAYEYLKTWRRIYSRKLAMDTISDFDMLDLLNRLGYLEEGVQPNIDKSSYKLTTQISEYKQNIKSLTDENEKQKKEIAELKKKNESLKKEKDDAKKKLDEYNNQGLLKKVYKKLIK